MHKLKDDEQSRLVDIVVDVHGPHIEYRVFSESMLALFEDIPGFETISHRDANRIVRQLWSQYRGQLKEQEAENPSKQHQGRYKND